MAAIPLDRIPTIARSAWIALRSDLQRILGDDLVAMWAYGGTVSLDDPARVGDLDTYAILLRPPGEEAARSIEEAQDTIARDHGVEWDAWYVLADAAAGADPPRHAWRQERRDTSWAINRAHWLAGRYASFHGAEPSELVAAPSWEELEAELDRELEHIERHVMEGDSDPYEATYAFLNGSRVLHALETRDVALSKRAAGQWALDHLPASWHPALAAAIRTYDGQRADGDAELIAAQMAPFVVFVRERMPRTDGRPGNAVPRWSGY